MVLSEWALQVELTSFALIFMTFPKCLDHWDYFFISTR